MISFSATSDFTASGESTNTTVSALPIRSGIPPSRCVSHKPGKGIAISALSRRSLVTSAATLRLKP